MYPISKISASQLIPENIFLHDLKNSNGVFQVEIDPIDYCNHNCKWCFTSDFRHDKKIAIIDLRKYIDEFCKLGGKSIVFSGGGEPLLYKDLYLGSNVFEEMSICNFLIHKGIYIGLITNGYLLDKLFYSDFAITDFTFIRISLDATNNGSHSELHQTSKSDFDKIIFNVKKLVEIRGTRFTPAIGVSFVVDPVNNINYRKLDIIEICSLATELKIDFVQFKHIHTSQKDIAIANMEKLHTHCLELNWGNVEFWVQSYDSANDMKDCIIAKHIQAIGNNSKRFPCCHLFGREEYLDQSKFLPIGAIITNCNNKVCRYNEMNTLLRNRNFINDDIYIDVLKASIENYGFHPFRYCPTAPNILKPFKTK